MNEKGNSKQIVSTPSTQSLIQDLRQIIEQARGQIAATANYALSDNYKKSLAGKDLMSDEKGIRPLATFL